MTKSAEFVHMHWPRWTFACSVLWSCSFSCTLWRDECIPLATFSGQIIMFLQSHFLEVWSCSLSYILWRDYHVLSATFPRGSFHSATFPGDMLLFYRSNIAHTTVPSFSSSGTGHIGRKLQERICWLLWVSWRIMVPWTYVLQNYWISNMSTQSQTYLPAAEFSFLNQPSRRVEWYLHLMSGYHT